MTNGRTAQEILNSPEALRLREKRARLVAERGAALAEEQSRWDAEIATLERRTRTEIEEIDLGNGDTIAVWACLSADETRLLGYLQKAQVEIVGGRNPNDLPEEDAEALDEIQREIIELVTANPMITARWLKENPGRFATQDVLVASIGYYARMGERVERAARARSFRGK